jgi:regulator of ribonuclease activity A
MTIATTDLCDRYPDDVAVVDPVFTSFGGRTAFAGPIATVRVREDNVLVRGVLSEPGERRVLVVDGGGSRACALLGDQVGALAVANVWAGLLVHGCVRDVEALAVLDLGVVALAAHPRRSGKLGGGERDVPVTFAGVTFVPGHHLVADRDGIVVLGFAPTDDAA